MGGTLVWRSGAYLIGVSNGAIQGESSLRRAGG